MALFITVTNTGNLTLKGFMVDVPEPFRQSLACVVGNTNTPFNFSSTALQPLAQMVCNASLTVRQEDIEGEDHYVATVTVEAPAVDLAVEKNVTIFVQWRPEATVEVNPAECSSVPAKAGAWQVASRQFQAVQQLFPAH